MPVAREPWLSGVALPRPKLEEPSFDEASARFYRAGMEALEGERIPFLLGGAAALHHHTGIWRDTKDLDLYVKGEDLEEALAALEAMGSRVMVVDSVWISKAHAPDSGAYLDLLHANSNGIFEVDDEWFERAVPGRILGHPVRVAGAEDTLLSKLFVGSRDRWDGADVLHLIYTGRARLDWEGMLTRLGSHWELLLAYLVLYRYVYPAHAHHVPAHVWRLLTDRWEGLLKEDRHPDEAPFRGRLLDPISFEVDVLGWGLPDARAPSREAVAPAGGRYA